MAGWLCHQPSIMILSVVQELYSFIYLNGITAVCCLSSSLYDAMWFLQSTSLWKQMILFDINRRWKCAYKYQPQYQCLATFLFDEAHIEDLVNADGIEFMHHHGSDLNDGSCQLKPGGWCISRILIRTHYTWCAS